MSTVLINPKLRRALAVVDLEATDPDPAADRIVEVGGLELAPDAEPSRYRSWSTRRVDHRGGLRRPWRARASC